MVDQTTSSVAMAADYQAPTAVKPDLRTRLQNLIPKLVLSPSLALILVFVYGFIIFSVYLSFTGSRILPVYDWVGLENYEKLFRLRHWSIAIKNLGIFAGLLISGPLYLGVGYVLAKFGYQRKSFRELRADRTAGSGRSSGGSSDSGAASASAGGGARAKPAPTKRTSGGFNRPTSKQKRR